MKYIHLKTNNYYIRIKDTIVKIEGIWQDCVIYQNKEGQQFVRLKEDFENNFKEV